MSMSELIKRYQEKFLREQEENRKARTIAETEAAQNRKLQEQSESQKLQKLLNNPQFLSWYHLYRNSDFCSHIEKYAKLRGFKKPVLEKTEQIGFGSKEAKYQVRFVVEKDGYTKKKTCYRLTIEITVDLTSSQLTRLQAERLLGFGPYEGWHPDDGANSAPMYKTFSSPEEILDNLASDIAQLTLR